MISMVDINTTCVVTVNFNSADDTCELLDSFLEYSSTGIDISVVDNNSSDHSVDILNSYFSDNGFTPVGDEEKLLHSGHEILLQAYKREYREIKFIVHYFRSSFNGGFGFGNNIPLKYFLPQDRFNYYWVLNNDIVFNECQIEQFLERSQSEVGSPVIGSRLIYEGDRDRLQAIGGRFNSFTGKGGHVGEGLNPLDVDECNAALSSVDYPIGACMFFPKAFFSLVGIFDEDYFLYFEELDLVLRARNKGERFVVLADTHIYHKCGASINQDSENKSLSLFAFRQLKRSRLILFKKHFPFRYPLAVLTNLSDSFIMALRHIKKYFNSAVGG